jgi:hypothetical protein
MARRDLLMFAAGAGAMLALYILWSIVSFVGRWFSGDDKGAKGTK